MKNKYILLTISGIILLTTWLFMSAGYFSVKHKCLSSGGEWDAREKSCKKLELIQKSSSIVKGVKNFVASRPADTGCEWGEIAGAGLKIIAETCDFGGRKYRIAANETLPGFTVEFNDESSGWQTQRNVITVFRKDPVQPIDVLMPLVTKASDDFKKGTTCTFEQVIAYDAPGLKHYQLVPAEKTKELYDIEAARGDAVPNPPCGKYGINADSVSYFEIQDNRPDVVLYVDIGQEAPPFDEKQIQILP